MSRRLALLLVVACGTIVANIYYAQPLAGPIAASLGLAAGQAGLIVTMSQLGYGLGLLLVVPLGDLAETRRLVLWVMAVGMLALLGAAASRSPAMFLFCTFGIGLGSVSVQVLVPFAAHLAPAHRRGEVVGNVMSGLMLGIMLSRPLSSLVYDLSSWRTVFAGSAGLMVLLGLVLHRVLPRRQPPPGPRYGALLRSMAELLRDTPVLRRRAFYHACLFGAFSSFWTTVPLLLAQRFGLSQSGIAVFALVGVSGAIAAPVAGRLADRGWTRTATRSALAGAGIAFALMLLAGGGSRSALLLLGACAVLLDFCVTAHLVTAQRAIFALGADARSRLNGLFMALFFAGGGVGSALGGWSYARGGWSLCCVLGLLPPLAALAATFGGTHGRD